MPHYPNLVTKNWQPNQAKCNINYLKQWMKVWIKQQLQKEVGVGKIEED